MVQAVEANSAKDLIQSIGAELGKDYSDLIRSLQENEIETLDDLANLEPADFTTLGISMALKNRVKKILEQRHEEKK